MRRNSFTTSISVKTATLHLLPHFMTFLPRQIHPFIATQFFFPLIAHCIEGQRNIVTTKTMSRIPVDYTHELFEAIERRDIFMIKWMVKEGSNINAVEDGQTPLHRAVNLNDDQIILLLLELGADPNAHDRDNKTPLSLYLQRLHINHLILKKMMEHGAILDINDGNYKTLFQSKFLQKELLSILLSGQPHTDSLYRAVLQDDPDTITHCLQNNANMFTRYQLELIYMSATNNHRFHAVKILFHHLKSLYQAIPAASKRYFKPYKQSGWEQRIDLIFPDAIPPEKQVAFRNAFDRVNYIFSSPSLYFALLNRLDKSIADLRSDIGFDFSTITPGEAIPFNSFNLPSAPTPSTPHFHDHDDLLRSLIRKKLAKHHIDTQNTCHTFSGFVDTQAANAKIRSGSLFKEQFLMGNAIMHGLHSHYLQWYILADAYECTIIQLEQGITLRDVLTASVDITTRYANDLVWQSLFDKVNYTDNRAQEWYAGLPNRLNNVLLFRSDLPHLRGLLLNSWYSSISELQKMVEVKYGQKPPYEVIGAQTIAHATFDLFDLGITNEDVQKYCLANRLGDLDLRTGIIHETKPTTYSHLFFTPLDKSKVSSAFETNVGTDSWIPERKEVTKNNRNATSELM